MPGTDEQGTSPTGPHDPPTNLTNSGIEGHLAACLADFDRIGPSAFEAYCHAHPQVADELSERLDWLQQSGFLDRDRKLPENIGPYRVRGLLGAGGMGNVYIAEQTEPIQRSVALKVIQPARLSPEFVARFSVELQALALLNHDGIARVYDAGRTTDDLPYFAMEYVPGPSITRFCEQHAMPLEQRLALFVQVCAAVEHAHQRGILHRDLKPSNILVHGTRKHPVAKIIDFGLAKAIESDASTPSPSEPGRALGTYEYMSPEQAEGRSSIDTRTDVYSLGALLYELLTGLQPLRLSRRETSTAVLIQTIRDRDPVRPSARVKSSARTSDPFAQTCGMGSHSELRRHLLGDLDAITMQALEKVPDRRYRGVAQLAEDIDRFLRCQPVSATAQTRSYLAAKFVRRHRAAVSVVSVFLLGLISASFAYAAIAADRQRQLDQFNLFGLIRELVRLDAEQWQDPTPARTEYTDEFETWIEAVEFILATRPEMRHNLAALDPGSESHDLLHWESGVGARRVLAKELRDVLDMADKMEEETGMLSDTRRRLDWASKVEGLTVDADRDAWSAVTERLRGRKGFEDLELTPQVGLVPLGPDPDSGCEEFAYRLPGGEIPVRSTAGRGFEMHSRSCPVFVLVPGGEVTVGSQSDDEHAERYDPDRQNEEFELRRVTLRPFFASKYEFTHGQWELLTHTDKAAVLHVPDSPIDATHPVVNFTKEQLQQVLWGYCLRLPSSEEWETLARAGTDSPWWCGRQAARLEHVENIADATLELWGKPQGQDAVPWNDGYSRSAPVGSFAANPLGFHDVQGNVSELCLDTNETEKRYDMRSGNWHRGWRDTRIGKRYTWSGAPSEQVGFRPALSIQH